MDGRWIRDYFTANKTDLSKNTTLKDTELLDYLVESHAITEDEKHQLESERWTDYTKASKLYERLPLSDIDGYVKMMDALRRTNQQVARNILLRGLQKNVPDWEALLQSGQDSTSGAGTVVHVPQGAVAVTLGPEVNPPTLKNLAEDPEIKQLFSKEVYEYIFNEKRLELIFESQQGFEHDGSPPPPNGITLRKTARGMACLLNVIDFNQPKDPLKQPLEKRTSSICDVRNFKDFWEQLDYSVFPYVKTQLEQGSKTQKNIMDFLQTFIEECKKTNPASIVVFLGSHGCYVQNQGSCIATSDNKPIYVEEIVKLFYSSNCPELQGKPKFFFIQACQGYVSLPDAAQPDEDINILVFEATSPGMKAYRNSNKGSWAVVCFIDAVLKHGRNKSLQEILEITSSMVQVLKTKNVVIDQIPAVSKNTMPPLYFNL